MTLPRLSYRGVTLNQRTIDMIEAAELMIGHQLTLIQGSYNAGGVDASAGTHDGGGAIDCWGNGVAASSSEVAALRAVGFAAWVRDPSQGDWGYHIHAIAIGDPDLSSGAQIQVDSYYAGGDGLAGAGGDYHPRPNPIPVWNGTQLPDPSTPPVLGDEVCIEIGPGVVGSTGLTNITNFCIGSNPAFDYQAAGNAGVSYLYTPTQDGVVRIDGLLSSGIDGSVDILNGRPYVFLEVDAGPGYTAAEGPVLQVVDPDQTPTTPDHLLTVYANSPVIITIGGVPFYDIPAQQITWGPVNLVLRVNGYGTVDKEEHDVTDEFITLKTFDGAIGAAVPDEGTPVDNAEMGTLDFAFDNVDPNGAPYVFGSPGRSGTSITRGEGNYTFGPQIRLPYRDLEIEDQTFYVNYEDGFSKTRLRASCWQYFTGSDVGWRSSANKIGFGGTHGASAEWSFGVAVPAFAPTGAGAWQAYFLYDTYLNAQNTSRTRHYIPTGVDVRSGWLQYIVTRHRRGELYYYDAEIRDSSLATLWSAQDIVVGPTDPADAAQSAGNNTPFLNFCDKPVGGSANHFIDDAYIRVAGRLTIPTTYFAPPLVPAALESIDGAFDISRRLFT